MGSVEWGAGDLAKRLAALTHPHPQRRWPACDRGRMANHSRPRQDHFILGGMDRYGGVGASCIRPIALPPGVCTTPLPPGIARAIDNEMLLRPRSNVGQLAPLSRPRESRLGCRLRRAERPIRMGRG